jgi:hypothetical protein
MSIFGTNQVEEVIIGNAVATEGTASAFIASADNKEIKAVAIDGGAAAEGKLFYLLQKTGGDAGKALNYEFSQAINPKKIERITLKEYAPEVQKAVTVAGFDGNVKANTTYSVQIRLYNEGGSLSTENFRILHGFYNTGSDVTGVTAGDIRDGIVASLNAELESRGASEFVVTQSDAPTALTITGKFQPVVAGTDTGRQIEFDVQGKVLDEAAGENLGYLTATVDAHNYPGNGTAKQVINKEWFVKGFKYEPYRGLAYPNGFNTPYYANASGIYNAVIITYKSDRISPTVEDQKKSLIIYVEKPTNDNPGNAGTNSLLADLRAFCDDAIVPADLTAI